jgi:hypothetical protein
VIVHEFFQRVLYHFLMLTLHELMIGFPTACGAAVVVREHRMDAAPVGSNATLNLPFPIVVQVKARADFV